MQKGEISPTAESKPFNLFQKNCQNDYIRETNPYSKVGANLPMGAFGQTREV